MKNLKQPRRKKSQDEDDKMKRRDENRKMNEANGTETMMKDNKTSRRVENESRQEYHELFKNVKLTRIDFSLNFLPPVNYSVNLNEHHRYYRTAGGCWGKFGVLMRGVSRCPVRINLHPRKGRK